LNYFTQKKKKKRNEFPAGAEGFQLEDQMSAEPGTPGSWQTHLSSHHHHQNTSKNLYTVNNNCLSVKKKSFSIYYATSKEPKS
jgi:hypothetical protein